MTVIKTHVKLTSAIRVSIDVKMGFFSEYLRFLKSRKKLWLAPIVLLLMILGLLIMLAQSSVIGPFIYVLF